MNIFVRTIHTSALKQRKNEQKRQNEREKEREHEKYTKISTREKHTTNSVVTSSCEFFQS